jgi:hypothetical protein
MRALDWPVMIDQINKSGIKLAEIERKTGISENYLTKIRSETKGTDTFNQAIDLLDMYLQTINANPPRVGDYYEF